MTFLKYLSRIEFINGGYIMSIIGEVVKNIYKYGNCKIYLPVQNPKGVRAISFTIDKDGKLNISQFLESYDRPFWDGNKKREGAVLERSIEALKYKEKDFILASFSNCICFIL